MRAEVDVEEPFGPYLVYERLGVGGMATVHRALERGIEGFERIVALKRLLPHLAEDASFIKAFVREAKLASALSHINIVQIFELGRVGTEYFISMEYIDGRDIRRILRHARKVTGPPPVAITVGILLQLCDALEFAHTKHDETGQPMLLVHRDVSPSNVLITTAGSVKVIDFGIAKAQSSTLRTQTGRVKGKLAYMAPEALSGRELDARSDLFAVGVIAHELLTARPLFASKNEYETLLKVQRGDIIPPSTFNQSCHPELDAIVLKALARDPDERFHSAADLREALLALRARYKLQSDQRDIANWINWAFSLEVPTEGFSGATGDQPSVSRERHTPTPRPRRNTDEDAAVEIAWGGGAGDGSGPVVLEDVPDVSEKHIAPILDASSRSLFDDEPVASADDIPTPVPSHGVRHPTRGSGTSLVDALHAANDAAATMESMPAAIRDEAASLYQQRTAAKTQPNFPAATSTAPSFAASDDDPPADELFRDPPPSDSMPIVRFRPPSIPPNAVTTSPRPISLVTPAFVEPRNASTTPGHKPAAVAPAQRAHQLPNAPHTANGPRKALLVVAGVIAVGTITTAVTLFLTRGERMQSVHEAPAPLIAAQQSATVKFVLEPSDAEVSIAGSLVHAGSPWQTNLAPGTHQIQIQRTGYKAWLTALDVEANETSTLRVVLEPINAATVAEATLVIRSSPSGLDAVLDGRLLAIKTPIKMPLSVGPHSIVLRQDGVDVWRQELVAQANAEHEFSPDVARLKERQAPTTPTAPAPRQIVEDPRVPSPARASVVETRLAIGSQAAPVGAEPKAPPAEPRKTTITPAPIVTSPVAPPTPPVLARPTPATPRVPPTVAPSMVTKLAGELPELSKTRHGNIPPVVAVKLCIDHTGGVTSTDLITKMEARAALEMVQTLKTWRYSPYKSNGTPTPACFAVSFRTK